MPDLSWLLWTDSNEVKQLVTGELDNIPEIWSVFSNLAGTEYIRKERLHDWRKY